MNESQNPDEHVVLHTFSDASIAEIVAIGLRDEGIPCEVEGEHQAGFTGAGVLSVRLLVRAADLSAAQALLAKHKPL